MVVACSSGGGTNGDAGSDAPLTNDAVADAPSANDAGDAGNPTKLDASQNDASAALITQCQSLAQNFATQCAGDDTRPCYWNAYASLCVTGETQLLVDSMNCLEQDTCRTFSDPNQGESCLDTTHASEESQASQTWIVNECTTCGGSQCQSAVGPAEIFPYLTDADIAALSSCAGSACDLGTLISNCASTIPDIALFAQCGQ